MIEFIVTAIILSIGFAMGAYTFHLPTKWKPWEDICIVYEDYTYSLLQARSNNKGDRQFRMTKIVKYANLNQESQQKIFEVIGTLGVGLKLDKK